MQTINIISDSIKIGKIGGPNKVIINTLKGLDLIGYPYVLNKNVHQYRYNWIHDSSKGFIEIVNSKIPAILGPNIYTLPKDIPYFTPSKYKSIYLHPSKWCVDFWKDLGYTRSDLKSWPAGIDTFLFPEMKVRSDNKVMIYLKKRERVLLEIAERIVKSIGLIPITIEYGSYNEVEYQEILSKASFGIWIGCSESQGIGLQEALSTNLPLIVWDVNSLLDSTQKEYIFPKSVKNIFATSVPYWDSQCGIIIHHENELKSAIIHIMNNLTHFSPRKYILENLTLEKQAQDLLRLFDLLDFGTRKSKVKHNNPNEDFSMSIKSSAIYYFYVVKRKAKTVLKLIRNKFIK